jgi:hypothetical protein
MVEVVAWRRIEAYVGGSQVSRDTLGKNTTAQVNSILDAELTAPAS